MCPWRVRSEVYGLLALCRKRSTKRVPADVDIDFCEKNSGYQPIAQMGGLSSHAWPRPVVRVSQLSHNLYGSRPLI